VLRRSPTSAAQRGPTASTDFLGSSYLVTVMSAPHYCRPEAYHLFAGSLPELQTTAGLIQAAMSLSLHALDDLDPGFVNARLDALAQRVLERARPGRPEALLAHLHRVLFDEEQFGGDNAMYSNPLCSYLPAVLETRRGIPITLALIYKAVAERVGLEVDGINLPGHFLVRVRDSSGWMLIDPFYGGRVLTIDEAYHLADQIFQCRIDRSIDMTTPATHFQWVTRMLLNLKSDFQRRGCNDDLAAMTEFESLLDTTAF
jgi:regulator of sirC expression with transglutaminase-like and TPR domain